MKITTLPPLEPHSVVLLELDIDVLKSVIDTKHLFVLSSKRLLATIAWRHLNLETGLFEVGIRFIENWRRDEFEHLVQTCEVPGA